MTTAERKAPLDDPTYAPKYPPLPSGGIPAEVERFGPRTQVRWFDRFGFGLGAKPPAVWDRYYVTSVLHRGNCCESCMEDQRSGYSDLGDENDCCCIALRERL